MRYPKPSHLDGGAFLVGRSGVFLGEKGRRGGKGLRLESVMRWVLVVNHEKKTGRRACVREHFLRVLTDATNTTTGGGASE